MATGGGRRDRGGGLQAWPGYVDALSTLLMVLIFVLMVFVLAQGFLSVALSSRDQALERLNRQVAELAEMLALERGQVQELRGTLTRAEEALRLAAAARDVLAAELRDARDQRDRAGVARDATQAERDRLAARVADLELAARGGAERLSGLEAQLAEARRRAEAAGSDAAQTLLRLTETARSLAAEQAARGAAEARAGSLEREVAAARAGATAQAGEIEDLGRQLREARAALAEGERQLAAMREQMAALDRQVTLERATVEARLSDIAGLSGEIRALSALRDRLERQAREAEARAAAAAEARTAAEQTAAREAEARQGAEAARQEAVRLGESARAEVALLNRQLEELRVQLARLAAALDAAEIEAAEQEAQVANLGQRLNAALAARVEELQRYRSDFFGRLRAVLGERPDVRAVGDRFVFQSEVLFPAGSAELSERGQQQIRDIARVLTDIAAQIPPDLPWVLRVDGHADRTPIRTARFASNWELAAARAIAVAQLLIAEGLPASRVAATSFGDNQPLDPADAPEAYARNRRIELRLTDR